MAGALIKSIKHYAFAVNREHREAGSSIPPFPRCQLGHFFSSPLDSSHSTHTPPVSDRCFACGCVLERVVCRVRFSRVSCPWLRFGVG